MIKTGLSKYKQDSSQSEFWKLKMYPHVLWPCKIGVQCVVIPKPLWLGKPRVIFPRQLYCPSFSSPHFSNGLHGWQQKDHLSCPKYLVLIIINHAAHCLRARETASSDPSAICQAAGNIWPCFYELLFSIWNLAVPVVIPRGC